nr:uncharacterized protein LOC111757377 [Cavia porcellus]
MFASEPPPGAKMHAWAPSTARRGPSGPLQARVEGAASDPAGEPVIWSAGVRPGLTCVPARGRAHLGEDPGEPSTSRPPSRAAPQRPRPSHLKDHLLAEAPPSPQPCPHALAPPPPPSSPTRGPDPLEAPPQRPRPRAPPLDARAPCFSLAPSLPAALTLRPRVSQPSSARPGVGRKAASIVLPAGSLRDSPRGAPPPPPRPRPALGTVPRPVRPLTSHACLSPQFPCAPAAMHPSPPSRSALRGALSKQGRSRVPITEPRTRHFRLARPRARRHGNTATRWLRTGCGRRRRPRAAERTGGAGAGAGLSSRGPAGLRALHPAAAGYAVPKDSVLKITRHLQTLTHPREDTPDSVLLRAQRRPAEVAPHLQPLCLTKDPVRGQRAGGATHRTTAVTSPGKLPDSAPKEICVAGAPCLAGKRNAVGLKREAARPHFLPPISHFHVAYGPSSVIKEGAELRDSAVTGPLASRFQHSASLMGDVTLPVTGPFLTTHPARVPITAAHMSMLRATRSRVRAVTTAVGCGSKRWRSHLAFLLPLRPP